MKVSQLIEQLQKLQEQHGDLPVVREVGQEAILEEIESASASYGWKVLFLVPEDEPWAIELQ